MAFRHLDGMRPAFLDWPAAGHSAATAVRRGRVRGGKRCRQSDEATSPDVLAGSRLTDGLRRWWWLVALLIVASLVIGATVQHAFDQRSAARALYRSQLLTTASQFMAEEQGQIALPVAQRSA